MIIEFECNNPDCDNKITKYLRKAVDIPPFLECGECGVGKLERLLLAPTTNSTQIVDNGVQARQVEVKQEVVEKEEEKARGKES